MRLLLILSLLPAAAPQETSRPEGKAVDSPLDREAREVADRLRHSPPDARNLASRIRSSTLGPLLSGTEDPKTALGESDFGHDPFNGPTTVAKVTADGLTLAGRTSARLERDADGAVDLRDAESWNPEGLEAAMQNPAVRVEFTFRSKDGVARAEALSGLCPWP